MADAGAIDPNRLNALKKNIEYLYTESVELTTVPITVLIEQIFVNAGQRGLPSKGHMGGNGEFIPDGETLHGWIEDYFNRVLGSQPQMPEA